MVLEQLTSREAEDVARETRDLVESRDIVPLAVTALSAAGGVVVAQTVSDLVLDAADLNTDPEDLIDYGAAIGVKVAVAVGFAFVAANLSGIGLIASGVMALGALASAGADALEMILVKAPLGDDNPLTGSSIVSNSRSNSRSSGRRVSARAVSGNSKKASSSSGSFGSNKAAAGSGF